MSKKTISKLFSHLNEPKKPWENFSQQIISTETEDIKKINKEILCSRKCASAPDTVTIPVIKRVTIPESFLTENVDQEINIFKYSFLTENNLLILNQIQEETDKIEELEKFIASFFSTKRERSFFLELSLSILNFCKDNNFNDEKTLTLFSLFYEVHKFITSYLWKTTKETYEYFKKNLLLNSMMCPPTSKYIFNAIECKNCLLYFCYIYLRNLPLIRVLLMNNYILVLKWSEEEQETIESIKEVKTKPDKKNKKQKR